MSRIVALSLTYAALSGAAVQSATNASFGRYTEEQLKAWWDANVAQPRPGCRAYRCAARKRPAPRRVAVLLRGEAFRTSPRRANRGSCNKASIAAQARITTTHVALLERRVVLRAQLVRDAVAVLELEGDGVHEVRRGATEVRRRERW